MHQIKKIVEKAFSENGSQLTTKTTI